MPRSALRVAVFGLGQAGSRIAADLARAGAIVTGFDPAAVPTPAPVERVDDPVLAVAEAGLVLGITAATDALAALQQALDAIQADAVYADLSTSSPAQERALAEVASGSDLAFVDVALMSTVIDKGARTPQLVSGAGAWRYVELMRPLGVPVEVVGEEAGEAAMRKLLRSIFMKGLASVTLEAREAARVAGLGEWLREHLANEAQRLDGPELDRLVDGTAPHAVRRRDEMIAAKALVEELGLAPTMTAATVESLDRLAREQHDDEGAASG